MSCKGCENRRIGCHADCEDYAAQRAEIEAIKDAKNLKAESDRRSYIRDIKQKMRKRRHTP